MCWEHEDKYSETCFDFLWDDYGIIDHRCMRVLLETYGIEFDSPDEEVECKHEFFKLLTSWHDKGKIRKLQDDE